MYCTVLPQYTFILEAIRFTTFVNFFDGFPNVTYCNAQKPQYIELFQMLLTDEFICKKKKGPGSHMSIFLKHPLADVFVGKMSAALQEGFNFNF